MLSSLQTLNFKWVEKKDQLTVDSTIKIDQIDDSIHVKKTQWSWNLNICISHTPIQVNISKPKAEEALLQGGFGGS